MSLVEVLVLGFGAAEHAAPRGEVAQQRPGLGDSFQPAQVAGVLLVQQHETRVEDVQLGQAAPRGGDEPLNGSLSSPCERGWSLLLGEVRQREEAEKFAREHGLNATLSPRHVQRLVSGHRADGKPLGPVRPVTRRLLEEMLNVPADQLLQPVPAATANVLGSSDDALQLRARIATGRNLDADTVSLLRQKLDITRVIDRRLGASALLGELQHQIEQMEQALGNVLNQQIRTSLAEVVVDASALAGWQSLDQGLVTNAWNDYNRARSAAREADSRALEAYACAGQAVVLLDVGETRATTELTEHARTLAKGRVPRLLQTWLTAGYGEACAAHGDRHGSMRAFDEALNSMPSQREYDQTPYLVFDPTHLARWRGSALARLGAPEAVDVLSDVLDQLDPTFTRAATATGRPRAGVHSHR